MKVKDAMTREVVTVRPEASLAEVARLMLERRIGSVVVVDEEGRPAGIVTETDFLFKEKGIPFSAYRLPTLFGRYLNEKQMESLYAAGEEIRASEVMSRPVRTVTEETELWKAASIMHHEEYNRLPVVRDGRLVGIIARHDLLKRMADEGAGAE